MENKAGLPVKHVSETAFLVAAWRAVESQRPDAAFRDPLAEVLAGEEGRKLIRKVPQMRAGEWIMAMRTSILDEFILEQVEAGADTVINLAAGLDTRPYRLEVPSSLHWIEADLPGITDFKEERLASHIPRCRLTRRRVDLADPLAQGALFEEVAAQARHAVAITEGLLYYLEVKAVLGLATAMQTNPAIRTWLMDLVDARLVHAYKENSELEADDVRFHFWPTRAYFENLGWKTREFRTFLEQGRLLNRTLPRELDYEGPGLDEAASQTGILSLMK